MNIGLHLLFGFTFAVGVSYAAWRLHALDAGGALSAVLAGGFIFGFGGLGPSAALLTFFLTGSALSSLPLRGRVHPRLRPLVRKEEIAGGYARNWKQVAANGSIPLAAILASQFIPSHSILLLHAFYGAVAAMCADSWGTEIGTRFGGGVKDILSGLELPGGESGGVSLLGMAGSILGAGIIALAAAWTRADKHLGAVVPLGILLAGTVGAISDSILGSSVQAKFRRAGSPEIFEQFRPAEMGSRQVTLVSGYKSVRNNSVNFAASAIGALIIIVLLDVA